MPEASRKWEHDDLLADLAAHLSGADRMIWCDMQLGPSGSPRPDVYVLHRSYSRPKPLAFEIKVSKSDLRADTTAGKWQSYLKYASGVVFAVPDGLCSLADIPAQCGLIVRKAEVWRYARKPTLTPVSLTMDASMKLVMDGVDRVYRGRLRGPRSANQYRHAEEIRRRYGDDVACAIKDLTAARARIAGLDAHHERQEQYHRDRVEQIRKTALAEVDEINTLRTELAEFLGVDDARSMFSLRRAYAELKASVDADARVQQAEEKVRQAAHSLGYALKSIQPPEKPKTFGGVPPCPLTTTTP